MLYTLINSPYICDLKALLRIIKEGDDLLLLSDGVIAGLKKSSSSNMLKSSLINIYAIKNDIFARGLYFHISSYIKIINYIDYVKLTEKQPKQIIW